MIADAVLPWHPKRHGLFPRAFRPTVVAVLLVQQRMQQYALEQDAAEQQQAQQQAQAVGQPPLQQAHVEANALAALCPIHSTWVNGIIPLLPRLNVHD